MRSRFVPILLTATVVVGACSASTSERLETKSADSSPAPVGVPSTSSGSTAAPVIAAPLAPLPADRTFFRGIGAFAAANETRIDTTLQLPSAPYFVAGRLVAARQGEERNGPKLAERCGAPEGKPELGTDCVTQYKNRGIVLTYEVDDFRALASAKTVPGDLKVGARIEIDFFRGAYTTEPNRRSNDETVARLVKDAPIGVTFAMFVAPYETRWAVVGMEAWALVDPTGKLFPVVPGDEGADWLRNSLDQVRARIDQAVPR